MPREHAASGHDDHRDHHGSDDASARHGLLRRRLRTCLRHLGGGRLGEVGNRLQHEKAEYGDTYNFELDLSDSTSRHGLSFYTRLERHAFGFFPSDSISLDLRWIAPSDSVIISDTTFISVASPVDSSYYSRDFVSSYKDDLRLPEHGRWRLKARVLNDSEAIRGLGVIFTRR